MGIVVQSVGLRVFAFMAAFLVAAVRDLGVWLERAAEIYRLRPAVHR
jgi:hypothetical protein